MEPSTKSKNASKLIALAVVLIIIIWGVASYNSFINLNENVTKQWAQVENQLQRRYDLIPNLVATVKGNTKQERDVFGQIANARSHYAGAVTTDQKAQAATEVEGALARLLVITENYPDLQSSKSFQDLMVSIEGTENRLAVERGKYNDLVQQINARVHYFPNSIIAKLAGIHSREYFNVPTEAQSTPRVDFTQ